MNYCIASDLLLKEYYQFLEIPNLHIIVPSRFINELFLVSAIDKDFHLIIPKRNAYESISVNLYNLIDHYLYNKLDVERLIIDKVISKDSKFLFYIQIFYYDYQHTY